MAENKDTKIAGIEASQLTDLIKTIMAEARKPTELEQEELEARRAEREAKHALIEQEQASRRETSAQKLVEIENRKTHQQTCLHEGGRPVHPFTVFVSNDPFGGYILCQGCQAVIRPGEHRKHYPAQYGGMIIFDTRLFNSLYQKTSASGVFA